MADELSAFDRPRDEPNATALRHLHEIHRPVLLAYLTQLTRGDRHHAEDVVQETMLRAWRHPQARAEDGRWSRSWLITVARNIMVDEARAARIRPAEYSDDRLEPRTPAADDYDRLLDKHEVRAALTTLSPEQRDVLREIFFQERTTAETAAILRIPVGTVRSRTFYALRALRRMLLTRGFQLR
ncbi:sigma-70 family RNA polymerase sigma factor [Lentzea sp.]|uniref:sigma-70 family RNA polymerase sigma factor n=1 Tax=Lentzea sp. TaxID=56099 RepID=UPI002ED05C42